MTHIIGVLLTMIHLFELNVFMFSDTASRDASPRFRWVVGFLKYALA